MLEDLKVPIQLKLSALWTALMFCYVYGDYFGLYPPGQLKGMLEGNGPIGPTSQGSLTAVSALLIVPSLMTFLPVVLPPRLNRWLNVLLALAYTAVVAVTMPGSWVFYRLFSSVEILLSLLIAWYAWRWPKTTPIAPDDPGVAGRIGSQRPTYIGSISLRMIFHDPGTIVSNPA